MTKKLILGSSSKPRYEQLKQLGIPFEAIAPDIDETQLPNETPRDLVLRLAESKAKAVGLKAQNHLIIGCDQVMTLGNQVFGKPLSHDNAIKQLSMVSGKKVIFYNGLCLHDSQSNQTNSQVITTMIAFKKLDPKTIQTYVELDQPLHCAGSIKVESKGLFLIDDIESQDPFAVIGLPVFSLVKMLCKANFIWHKIK
jgi:septum formation protein